MVMTFPQNFMLHLHSGVVDLNGGITGDRVHLAHHSHATFVHFNEDGTGAVTLGFQEHTAGTAGTSASLAVVTDYWYMAHATDILTAGLTFTHGTQAAGASIDTSALLDNAELLIVVDFESSQLSDGYSWISCNITEDYGATVNGFGFWILGGTRYGQDVIATATS